MGDEEPGASAGFLGLSGGEGRGDGMGEDGDAAGAGAGGEEGRMRVDGVEERDDGGVDAAFR